MATKVTPIQRTALLRVRTAMRFRFNADRPREATATEAREEQAAAMVRIPAAIWKRLESKGLIEFTLGYSLTSKGEDALRAAAGTQNPICGSNHCRDTGPNHGHGDAP